MTRLLTISLCVGTMITVSAGLATRAAQDDSASRDIPPALAPFEYLVGTWRGQAAPMNNPAQRFRGWPEVHSWAWIFKGGKPIGMSVSFTGDKTFASGRLTHDAANDRYHFEAKTPGSSAKTIIMAGTYDPKTKILTLDADDVDHVLKDKVRLTLRPNGSFIRYTFTEERQLEGETLFHKAIEIGVLRDGERLAGSGGGDGADRPKCIVTGGAATMTVSFKGATYPLCCTGCRDEFNDNPEKYIKKASLMAAAQAGKPKTAAPAKVGRFDDAFSDDVPKARGGSSKSMTKDEPTPKDAPETAKPTPKKDAPSKDSLAKRAASLLKLGQTLEKNGNIKAALGYYKRVVKEFPNTPAARTAADRIKALDDN